MDEPLMELSPRPAPVMARGSGSWLWDEQGNAYLDFVQGWAVNALGHCPAEIVEVLQRQSQQLCHVGPGLRHRPQYELARALAQRARLDADGGCRIFFCNSGAEANEGAIKLVRKWGAVRRASAYEIITTDNAFHGRTLATMSASGKPGWQTLFEPKVPGFKKVAFGDVTAVERAIGPTTAAIMVEPIQGEGGVVVAPQGYLRGLRELADEHRLLLVFDEVQTGIGRTGELFAFEHEGVAPDILTLGKALGGGLPLSAVIARPQACCFEPGDQGGTFGGTPLLASVGQRVLQTVGAPPFLRRVREVGARLHAGLSALAAQHECPQVRGRGLLWALQLPEPRALETAAGCLQRGLLINAPREDVLRFMPALNVSDEDTERMLELLELTLRDAL